MRGTWLNKLERCSVKGSLKNCLNSYDEHVRVFAECIRSNWAPLLPHRCSPGGYCLSQFCLSARAITCEYMDTHALGTWLGAKWNLFYRPHRRSVAGAPPFNGTYILLFYTKKDKVNKLSTTLCRDSQNIKEKTNDKKETFLIER